MAAPAFVSATGHGGNPTTSATVTLPVTAANDILVLVAVNAGSTTALTPSGTYNGGAWSTVAAGAGTNQWGAVWWSRATGNHTGQTVIVGTATDSCSAGVMRVSGCLTSASPVDTNVSSANVTATGLGLTGFTTTVNETLVVFCVAADDNIAMSGQTMNGVAMTERGEFTSTGGADSIVGFSTAEKAVAGTTGNFAGTHASSLSKRLVAFALKPPVTTTYTDSMSGSVAFAGTRSGSLSTDNTRSGTTTFAGTASSTFSGPTTYNDSASGSLAFSGTRSSALATDIARSGQIVFAGTRSSLLSHAASRSGALTFDGTALSTLGPTSNNTPSTACVLTGMGA